ncbi:MAG: site-specific integrase, partial [Chloroflexota bacterium]|nr:site-specific integrase [Chloroflexota bacterium]
CSVAERVGGGYRLTGRAPRRRGGRAPSADEIAAVLAVAEAEAGFEGARNRTFFGILAATGTRVNALLELDGTACVELPSGRMRLFLHEKGKAECREVELCSVHADALQEYAEAFNRHASRQGWRARVQIGEPESIWRNSGRGRWPYQGVLATLRAACAAAGVPPFTPHALRRAFATDAASVLPRHVVALAGGWQGLERLDDHYVRPRAPVIWEKLQPGEIVVEEETGGHVIGEAVAVL